MMGCIVGLCFELCIEVLSLKFGVLVKVRILVGEDEEVWRIVRIGVKYLFWVIVMLGVMLIRRVGWK